MQIARLSGLLFFGLMACSTKEEPEAGGGITTDACNLMLEAACSCDDETGLCADADVVARENDAEVCEAFYYERVEGCDETGDDTGEPEPDPLPCTADINDVDPADGSTGWLYRDVLTVEFDEIPEFDSVRLELVDDAGTEVAFTTEWNEEHSLEVYLTAELTGSTTYILTAGCKNEVSTTFQTSVYGASMDVENADLIGNTYELDLPGANFTEPPAVGALLGSFLTAPLLANVEAADAESLTLRIAQGYWDDEGNVFQNPYETTYPFPAADFTSAPYFAADTERIDIAYGDSNIPIENMHLEGTFAPDGSSMGGAWFGGLVNTSEMAPLLELGSVDEPDVICEYLSVFGLSCEACGDGTPYCLYIEAHFGDARLVEGMEFDPDPLGESSDD